MKTASSAHVCTPGRVPIVGEIWADEAGELTALQAARSETPPPANWPGQRAKFLASVGHTYDASADHHDKENLSDSYQYYTRDGLCVAIAYRHSGDLASKWECSLSIYDTTGAKWWRNFPAVTDDFGWLVEVPAC